MSGMQRVLSAEIRTSGPDAECLLLRKLTFRDESAISVFVPIADVSGFLWCVDLLTHRCQDNERMIHKSKL